MEPITNNSDLETQINNAIENNLSGRMTILAALLAVQDDIGYIPQIQGHLMDGLMITLHIFLLFLPLVIPKVLSAKNIFDQLI